MDFLYRSTPSRSNSTEQRQRHARQAGSRLRYGGVRPHAEQDQRLHALGKDLLDSLAIQSESPCLLNGRDPRVHSHEFVVCNGLFPPGLNPQQPALDIKLGKTFPWHILSLNFPDEASDNPQEQEVTYTWEYEFSSLPAQLQEVLKGTPRPGRSLFRLDGGAWHWVAYQ